MKENEYEDILSEVVEHVVEPEVSDIMFLFLTDCMPELVDTDITNIPKAENLELLDNLKNGYKEWFEDYENSNRYRKILSFYGLKKHGFDNAFEDFWDDVETIINEYLNELNFNENYKQKSKKIIKEKYDWIRLEDFRLANIPPSQGGVNGLEAKSRSKTEPKKWVRGVILNYTPAGILRIHNKYLNKCYLRDNGDEVWYHL